MTRLESIEEKRVSLYQKYKKSNLIAYGFLALSAIAFLIAFKLGLDFVLLIAMIPVSITLMLFSRARKCVKEFETIVKNELITGLISDRYEEATYSPNQAIELSLINQVGMVREPDRYYGEDYFSGSYKGVKFEVSEVDLKQRVERVDSRGNRTVTYETYFKGRWYILRYNRVFKDTLKILERASNVDSRGLKKIETESIEFNKKFTILSSTQEYAFYQITPVFIEKLLELEKMHRGTICYCFTKNELHIGVNDSKNYFRVSIKTPINEESMSSIINDIDMVAAIVNEFKLNSQKYNS